jgi:hypothetical protein
MTMLQKKLLLLIAACLATQAGVNLTLYFREMSEGSSFGGDFICFWNAAYRVRHGDIAAIYDPDTWRQILSTKATDAISWFVYPPFTLFGLWLLGDATYNEAVLAWSLVPLVFYLVLVVSLAKRSGLGDHENRWPRAQAYAVLIAFSLPFLSANLFSGQTGAITAVFFLGAAHFWPTRPVLAGICIGLLAIKPQLGLLIPFALVASGQWRIFAAAATTILLLIVLSTLWLGAAIWADYLRMTQLYSDLVGRGHDQVQQLLVGPYVSLHGTGMPAALAASLQVLISLAVVTVIVRVFWSYKQERRQEDGRLDLRLGLLAAGTLLATPYSFCYDTPLLILSIIPLLARSWRNGWDGIELISVAMLLVSPYAQVLTAGSHIPFSFPAILLWFGVLYRRYQKEAPNPAASPAVSSDKSTLLLRRSNAL